VFLSNCLGKSFSDIFYNSRPLWSWFRRRIATDLYNGSHGHCHQFCCSKHDKLTSSKVKTGYGRVRFRSSNFYPEFRFTVTGLRPGTGYLVSITSSNAKGRSDMTKIHAFTTRQPERMTETDGSALTKVGEFTVTPILAILLVVGGALFLVRLSKTVLKIG